MIDLTKSFSLYFNGIVTYDGRATSILENGNYLIIKKDDNSIQLHGATNILPLNYQGKNCVITHTGNRIICKRKSETIEIEYDNILSLQYYELWSNNNIKLIKSENDLVMKLIANISNYITLPDNYEVIREYKTEYGAIDILIRAGHQNHIIEVKRKIINSSACVQVRKYAEQFTDYILYVAGPQIGKPATKYASTYGINFIQIDFD